MTKKHVLAAAALALPLALAPAAVMGQGGYSAPSGEGAGQTEESQAPAAAPETETAPEAERAPDTENATESSQAEAPTEPYIQLQEPGQTLASSLIGRNVTNPEGESLGKVSDLLLDEQGELTALIVQVGGFLGIGGKSIGVSLGHIEERTDDSGNTVMVLPVATEELEQLAAFKSIAQMEREREAAEQAAERQSQPGATPPGMPAR